MTEIETLKIVLNENLPKPTMIDSNTILSFGNHKLILGYLNAYFNHCPIKLNPNIIWQLILNNFSLHVKEHSDDESFRQKFVNFIGKKQLICIKRGSYEDVNKYQKDIIKDFCEQISENIGKELIDILTPNFTTSNENSIIAGKVTIMSAFSNFFDYYGMMMLTCGIPYIILEGSLNDWENLLNKLRFLSKYDFKIGIMENDIINIINAKKGIIDLNFWRRIIMETKIKEHRPCIFGGKKVEYSYIEGWILHFYNEYEIKAHKISDLIPEIVEVPIKFSEINSFNNNKIKKGIIYAGIREIKQDPNNYEVEPIVNYEFTFDENQEEIGNKEEIEIKNKKETKNEEKMEKLNDSEDYGLDSLFY